MTKNMGSADRIIRIIVAAAIAIFYFTGYISGTTAIILGVMALVFIGTSLLGYCPLYPLFGISTKKHVRNKQVL